jgi:hypothetical protein
VGGRDLQIVVQPFEPIERIEPFEHFLEMGAKKTAILLI